MLALRIMMDYLDILATSRMLIFREFGPKHMVLLEYSRFGAWSKCYHHHEKIDFKMQKSNLEYENWFFDFTLVKPLQTTKTCGL